MEEKYIYGGIVAFFTILILLTLYLPDFILNAAAGTFAGIALGSTMLIIFVLYQRRSG